MQQYGKGSGWAGSGSWLEKGALWLGIGLVLAVIIRTAWQSDDAYITYRCIDNALHGHGFTYNIAERVQAYTHPLWALLQMVVIVFTGEVYFSGIFLGILFSTLTLWVLAKRLTRNPFHFLFAALALLSSSAWVDYTTSGLENSLSYFLLAVFMAEWLGEKRLIRLCLIASLIILNRMDMLLLVAPALFATWWPQRSLRTVGQVMLGFLPFILWELFATFYYGFPFPNTAYAKLNVGIPSGELFQRGLHYLGASLLNDLPTFLLPVLAIGLGFIRRRPRLPALAIGVALYLGYIIKIGGGFMEGRFLTGPVLVGVVIIWDWLAGQWGKKANSILGGFSLLLVVVAIIQGPASILTGADFQRDRKDIITSKGVADERAYYYPQTGLLNVLAEPERPIHEWISNGYQMKESGNNFYVAQNMGFMGYAAGPDLYLIDGYALTDPFLSRFPPMYNPGWRAGHLPRAIPEGYLEGLPFDENRVVEPDLHQVYKELKLVTRGDLWSWNRIKTIVSLNMGGAKVEDRHRFLYPVSQSRSEEYPIYPGEAFQAEPVNLGHFRGVQVALKPFNGPNRIELGFEPGYSYVAIYRGKDDFFKGFLIEEGANGVTVTPEGTMRFTMDLEGERSMQQGDFLAIYGMWIYGRQALKYVKVGG